MAELKTQPNDGDVERFLATVEDERKRRDCYQIIAIMRAATGAEPKMWGQSMVGFGNYQYTYASGREGNWFLTGFAPRKQNLTLYIMAGFASYDQLLANLGKHKTGKSCLYLKRLDDVDLPTLRELIAQSVAHMREQDSGIRQDS
jgi:hypothetical protein